jgi:hypothetical protein
MARQAIRNEGADAEQQFIRLVKGAEESDADKKGDAIVRLDGRAHYVEVKYTTSNTINQIRAIKFIPLVIYSPQLPVPWAVLPAHEVVRMVSEKNRGQHTELALESANMTLSSISSSFRCRPQELSDTVHQALRAADRYPSLQQLLQDLITRLTSIKEEFREAVRLALAEGD